MPAARENVGFRFGNFEFHPELSVRGGYDTNVFKGDGEPGGQPTDGAAILQVTPGFLLTTIGHARREQGEGGAQSDPPPKLDLRAGAFATYFKYFGLDTPRRRDQGMEFDTSVDAHIMPKRPVSAQVGASWVRSARPFTAPTGTGGRKAQAFDSFVPRARLLFESRGGVLTSFVGYRPNWLHYEGSQFRYLSNIVHDVDAGIGWRFFPSTALLFDTTLSLQYYTEFDRADADGTQVLRSDNIRYRARLGLNGAFTKRLSLRVLGGYAAGTYEEDELDEFEDFVGEAVLTYRFPSGFGSFVEGGYTRNVSPSVVGGYMLADRGFARLKFVLARVFALTFEGGAGYVQYGRQLRVFADGSARPLGVNGATERNDVRVDVLARAEYRVLSWLGLLVDVGYTASITDFAFDRGIDAIPDPADFQTFQVNGGLRASY